jgi:RNA recognition motif. (a.k.a. RRM, RBD, or RNP domain)
VTERTVRDVFASQGFLTEVHLPIDSTTGKHAGFGYISFPSIRSARVALEALQGAHIDGHSINLEFSHSPPISALQASSGTTGPHGEPPASARASSRDSARELSHSRSLRHRQSWHPGSQGSEQSESKRVSFMNKIPLTQIRPLPSALGNGSSPPTAGKPNPELSSAINGNNADDTSKPLNSDSQSSLRQVTFEGKTTIVPQQGNDKNDHALLDEVDDKFELSARYHSLLPNENPEAAAAIAPDRLLALSPNAEMARFPPVSQLDALLLATQHRAQPPTNIGQQTGRGVEERDDPTGQPVDESTPDAFARKRPSRRELQPGPSSHRPEDILASPPLEHSPARLGQSRLRRSYPTIPAASVARLTSPFDPLVPLYPPVSTTNLRRSATEGHSRRDRPSEGRFVERLSIGERRPNWTVPGSFPVDEPAMSRDQQITAGLNRPSRSPFMPVGGELDADMQTAIQQSIIDNCVDTLVKLGYGRGQDGGRQRLAVYAQAVGGKLAEAVEMIEEERKAYAQQETSSL